MEGPTREPTFLERLTPAAPVAMASRDEVAAALRAAQVVRDAERSQSS